MNVRPRSVEDQTVKKWMIRRARKLEGRRVFKSGQNLIGRGEMVSADEHSGGMR